MGTMTVADVLVESPRTISPVETKQIQDDSENQSSEAHPLVAVFIAALVAFNLSMGMIGPILIWLSQRHSGVMAP
jgi:uncharacterized Tic20 family protein